MSDEELLQMQFFVTPYRTTKKAKMACVFLGLEWSERKQVIQRILEGRTSICKECGKDLTSKVVRVEHALLAALGKEQYCSIRCSNISEEKKALIVKTNLERYGVSNAFQHGKALKNRERVFRDPKKLALIQKKIAKTHLERTGFTHHFNNPSVQLDIQRKSVFLKTVMIEGKEFKVRGYEDKAIRHMRALGIRMDCIQPLTVSKRNRCGFDYSFRGKERHYIPDFRVKHQGTEYVIEVKSPYTAGLENNKEAWSILKSKANAVCKAGEKFVLLVFGQQSDEPLAWSVGPLSKTSLHWRTQ